MKDQNAVEHWLQVDRLLDLVLALPIAERAAFVQQQTTSDPRLCDEVLTLLAGLETRGDLLDRPAADALSRRAPAPDLQSGQRIGAYRVVALLGRGGMGEVYRAERADGQFEQQIALKLLRQDAVEHLGLFVTERRILAKLEHPGIARLYDAGIGDDGRPYMVMELVEGVPITDWCRQRKAGLDKRLALFAQVCNAVTYAHQHLVIHRDLKPGNILVTDDGRAKLLDFGVAKLLSGAVEDATRNTPLTLSYGAPEQLTHAAVTTATDIYALGVLLFELLTDRLPWAIGQIPVAVAIDKVLHETAPALVAAIASVTSPPVPARLLSGDLDAIVGKALRKDPADRYVAVSDLWADVHRHLQGQPVVAREGARLYVFGRFVRRYRWAAAGVAALIVTLAAGLAGTAWQARRAEIEAARATVTKDFLRSIFRASDPRIASDKPRGEITARQLLDLGSERIEKEFSGQPDIQIELLGLTAAIYGNLYDEERYAAMQKRRIELARAHYGSTHPIVIEGLISEADAACVRQDYAKANRLLDETDALLKSAGHDQSLLRADWWRTKARALGAIADAQDERRHALDQALALYAKLAPRSNGFAAALNMASRDYTERGEHRRAREILEQALATAQAAPDRDDSLIAGFLNNLARKQEKLGEFVAADRTYERAEDLARKTHGEGDAIYWAIRAKHAQMLHQRGQRERANALFAEMLRQIPREWTKNTNDTWARETYAECLAAEGRAHDAIPLLEIAYQIYLQRPQYEYDVREVRRKLGDAYDRAGRAADARTLLKASRDEYLAKEGPASQWTLRIRERWGRFLLDHSTPGDADFTAAESEFRAALENTADRPLLEAALAHAGLARIVAARGDAAGAREESGLALAALERVQGLYDLRVQSRIWLVHSAVLLKNGDMPGAQQWADKALTATQRYDDASSPAIAAAEAAVRATAAVADRKVSVRK
jgi:eukaryotic-like serine/threonine-protein kinase